MTTAAKGDGERCPECGGTGGYKLTVTCRTCRGTGRIPSPGAGDGKGPRMRGTAPDADPSTYRIEAYPPTAVETHAVRTDAEGRKWRMPPAVEERNIGAALRSVAERALKDVMANREQILRAFIAETGLPPGECEQIQQTTDTGMRWFVRRREEAARIADLERQVEYWRKGHSEAIDAISMRERQIPPAVEARDLAAARVRIAELIHIGDSLVRISEPAMSENDSWCDAAEQWSLATHPLPGLNEPPPAVEARPEGENKHIGSTVESLFEELGESSAVKDALLVKWAEELRTLEAENQKLRGKLTCEQRFSETALVDSKARLDEARAECDEWKAKVEYWWHAADNIANAYCLEIRELRAQLTAATAERDEWKLKAEQANQLPAKWRLYGPKPISNGHTITECCAAELEAALGSGATPSEQTPGKEP